MGMKELIEKFHERFKAVRVRLTFVSEEHDLLDAYDPNASRLHEDDADIDRVCSEFLALPWFPGRQYWPETEGDEASEAAERKRLEEAAIAALAQADEYIAALHQNEQEAKGMDQDAACEHRRAFGRSSPDRFPLLSRKAGNGFQLVHWLYTVKSLAERLPKLLAIPTQKEQVKAYCGLIGSCADWGDSPGPVEIETVPENLARRRQEKRRNLEEVARTLAEKYKCPVYSIKFLRVCQRELDRHRTRREGLREDGLCATAYPGTLAGYEQWSEMDQDIQGDIAGVRDLIQWFQSEYPLLWADYQERRRRKREGAKK